MKTHIALAAAALVASFAGPPARADQAMEDCLTTPCPSVAATPTATVGNACVRKSEDDVRPPKQKTASAADVEGPRRETVRKAPRELHERQAASSWVLACRVVHDRGHKGAPQSCTDFGAHAFFQTPVECLTASKKFREMITDRYGWTAIAYCYRTR